MVVEASAIASTSKLLAPFLKSIYNGLSDRAKIGFEVWKSANGADVAANYFFRLSQVKTIWTRGDAAYIDEFYYPIILSEGEFVKSVESLHDIESQYFVVQGIVGQGKSIFMRYLALSLLKKSKVDLLPVFIELKDINEKVSMLDLIFDELRSLGLDPTAEVFDALASRNKIALFADGFDEIPGDSVSSVIRELGRMMATYPQMKIGVSSRPGNAIQNLPGFVVLVLHGLDSQDYDPFLERLGVDVFKRHALIMAVEDSPPEIREVMSTPLMLSIVVLIYESYQEIPSYLSEFFDALFHVVFTQHDRKKVAFNRHHYSGLSESDLQHLFEAFCFVVMNKNYGRALSITQFNECFGRAKKYVLGVGCNVQSFKKDIVGVACLMLDEGVGLTTFLHKGILDYFSAAFIARMDSAIASKFYAKCASNYSQWTYMLGFLEKIDHYRFCKFYELGPVKDECVELGEVLAHRGSDSILRYVAEVYPYLEFTYSVDGRLVLSTKGGAL
ncbi:hypothetical protein ALQ08_03562 [Pseudomonas syringae pv. delphinii]|uniref:NACHT domain-containing protein n=1 Tax=Pseudomonas syringae pv. delphinii TaxID=192088 RepID=A0A0P9PAR1_9PSED|nr:NACHT domain-containing protein [Pseudomonas syringae group genomosp. 3]KPX14878.1 Uncharacterized protein ALO72_03772 [Pseudomonas syringae pv. delphinii]RMP16399.1 hypothetical protein ALQ28_02517 [Pseudomonas syringae pv. delphinii]RMP17620.1 hypothetical protein ALQ27_03311 [Pseudomonas syringae pv. delphinii]RMQ25148.1 hypothetical protein ALQ08_03562 [Pseudomonas syringae pv. delphinii]